MFQYLLEDEGREQNSNPLTVSTIASIKRSAKKTTPIIKSVWLHHFSDVLINHKETKMIVEIDDPWMVSSPRFWAPTDSRSLYEDQEVGELVAFLKEYRDLEEQGDILQYMVVNFGMSQRVGCGNVQQLVEELYEKSCESKHWSIVRHASGLLSKKIPNLALSLTDLIVRQKQVTVGLPPHQEAIISHPLGAIELRDLIYSVHQADISTAVLTQELLSYLAMFIRTEPNLFHGMIRIRVGLIIQVLCVSKL